LFKKEIRKKKKQTTKQEFKQQRTKRIYENLFNIWESF